MEVASRPKSRLPNGKINPAYTAWRKNQKESPPESSTPEILSLKCVKLARNSRYIVCLHEGVTVPVVLMRGQRPPRLLKKTIRVKRDGETFIQVP